LKREPQTAEAAAEQARQQALSQPAAAPAPAPAPAPAFASQPAAQQQVAVPPNAAYDLLLSASPALLQAAVARIAVCRSNIFEAAAMGDAALVQDHVEADAASVHKRDVTYGCPSLVFYGA
jgi:hypothetical protein